MEQPELVEEVKLVSPEEVKRSPKPEDLFEKIKTPEIPENDEGKPKANDLFERIENEEEQKPNEDEADTPKKNKNKKDESKNKKKPEKDVEEENKVEIPNPVSSSVQDTISKISSLINDCLYDDAYSLAKELKASENFDITKLSKKEQNILVDVEETYKHIEEVCFYLNDDEGWWVDSSDATVTTKFKNYPNSSTITMKMEGELDFPIENMCSIVYEIEYFNEFVPFCKQSHTIKPIGKGAKLCYFMLNMPFWSNREGYIRGFGVDRIEKNNTLLIISKTIDEDKGMLERLEFDIPPPVKTVRLKMDHFCFEITPITRNKFKLKSLLNIDPRVSYVPQFVLNFFSRKIGGHMFSRLLYLAQHMDNKKWEEIHKKEESKEYYKWINKRIEQVERKTKEAEEKENAPVRI